MSISCLGEPFQNSNANPLPWSRPNQNLGGGLSLACIWKLLPVLGSWGNVCLNFISNKYRGFRGSYTSSHVRPLHSPGSPLPTFVSDGDRLSKLASSQHLSQVEWDLGWSPPSSHSIYHSVLSHGPTASWMLNDSSLTFAKLLKTIKFIWSCRKSLYKRQDVTKQSFELWILIIKVKHSQWKKIWKMPESKQKATTLYFQRATMAIFVHFLLVHTFFKK